MCKDTINNTILNILLILFYNRFKTLKLTYIGRIFSILGLPIARLDFCFRTSQRLKGFNLADKDYGQWLHLRCEGMWPILQWNYSWGKVFKVSFFERKQKGRYYTPYTVSHKTAYFYKETIFYLFVSLEESKKGLKSLNKQYIDINDFAENKFIHLVLLSISLINWLISLFFWLIIEYWN